MQNAFSVSQVAGARPPRAPVRKRLLRYRANQTGAEDPEANVRSGFLRHERRAQCTIEPSRAAARQK